VITIRRKISFTASDSRIALNPTIDAMARTASPMKRKLSPAAKPRSKANGARRRMRTQPGIGVSCVVASDRMRRTVLAVGLSVAFADVSIHSSSGARGASASLENVS
jgi:ribosomal protein L34